MLYKTILTSIFIIFSNFGLQAADKKPYEADLIIYGGTSAAVTAAVTAIKLGKTVIVVSPDIHLGGLSSSGLGFTDTGNKEVIGGLSRDFYHRVYLHYQQDTAWKWQKRKNMGTRGKEHLLLMVKTAQCGYLNHTLPKK
ncbi:FAD-dependent oxidoreductase [Pedobacter panaciterrae]